MVTSFAPFGSSETGPKADSVFDEATVKLPLTVVVPAAAPRDRVVAAPPILRVVAVVLNKLAVVFDEIRSADEAPETVIPAEAVTAPVNCEVPSTVMLPLVERSPAFVILSPVEP